jgi:hypothetical protein
MNLNTEPSTIEITDMLAATGENYAIEAIDLGEYGTSYEITKHDSRRKLHLTPVEDDMIDVFLFDENGNTLASGTMFSEVVKDLTSEELATIITICL